jgi:DNA-binding response OmpR family regulator
MDASAADTALLDVEIAPSPRARRASSKSSAISNKASTGRVAVDVALVAWPAESEWLERLRRTGQPRLLLVRADVDPPVNEDDLEDWVRTPADPIEVHARVAVLKTRAARIGPTLDDSGRLNAGSRWVDLSPIEYRLVGVLLENFGTLVTRDALIHAAWSDARPSENQLGVHILRLRRRLDPAGLRLRTVRRHGYLLDHSEQKGIVRRAYA